MSAYMIVNLDVANPVTYEEYKTKVPACALRYGAIRENTLQVPIQTGNWVGEGRSGKSCTMVKADGAATDGRTQGH